ncbi:tRNA (N6-threonylcarbamoyladenosine(37)-N6)-methyltransferase TrmO [Muribacter muris]|uniref:tRNA (N6-threonylcarbamoyladenosine(37)-N6)-methyltransferase TrmO n=1 Tax=Muribacter muris TaxID=67855 RepID=A0A4Y9K2H3_9PAST|nr:tRNA (N6-threonylcarbamoyladenosine(37)-N6)-methyltransferase TrmO [Muribacter muris]MBF0785008.1 tRNA (N6-threonylcarbamoyladenosine(37)-N6)-methyltransferase TrmO [Muribacter muris]MBF0827316.1 tRNA (N6-threonylcarbamoyladenosine(37)-N6)-methyltransferase TrmO [Muribacter muris]TFV10925.1 tRNA (N6-threonylcarbamoyladenosine(37)-N6)-methyltransferase TrmO [Muribacter muris]
MINPTSSLTLHPIGIVRSPYGEKFAVPRQPDLVPQGKGILHLLPPYNAPDAVRGLTQFSHLWLIFQFHQIPAREWHATVRPPRLGGNERIGVFASRATHRPNPLGLSKVKLERVEAGNGEVKLHLGSVDLVDGTPIFDIKPYLAYADSEPDALSGFAQQKPSTKLQVEFSAKALQAVNSCRHFARFGITEPLAFIAQVIAQDPRPAYQQGKVSERIYGMKLAGYNVLWQINAENVAIATVIDIQNGT